MRTLGMIVATLGVVGQSPSVVPLRPRPGTAIIIATTIITTMVTIIPTTIIATTVIATKKGLLRPPQRAAFFSGITASCVCTAFRRNWG
jgi:hypothetical protein